MEYVSTTFQSAPSVSRVEDVVRRGWRRRLIVLTFDHAAVALSLVFGGFTLLLLLGTQILAWQWLLLLAAIGIGLTAYEVRRRLTDAYQVAQMMDQRLSLHDSLSTAWFLHSQAATENPAAAHLLNHAEQLAETADPSRAFPFQRRRAWVITAALFVVACVLFSARYFVTHELSLEHSFLPLAVTQVFENIAHGTTADDRKSDDTSAHLDKTVPPGSLGKDADRTPPAPKTEQAKQPTPGQSKGGDANQKGDPAASQDQQQAKSADGKSGAEEKRDGKGEGKPDGTSQQASNDAQEQNKGDQQQDGKQPDSTGPQKSSSMMDRMRDALSSVMSKIKQNSANNQKSDNNNAQKSNEGQKSSDQAGNKDQSADGQKDSGKDQSAQEQSSGEQSQQSAAKAQAAQGKESAAPSDKKGSDAQSGVGHSDGDKQVRAAEQAKAMGKLAEIIGKRSANLTGDMQVVPSGKQRLQTDYTHAQGQHADLGGEINRDEVPVEDQEYVREYMERIRKKSAPVAKSPETTTPK
jgi:hypothetical protein